MLYQTRVLVHHSIGANSGDMENEQQGEPMKEKRLAAVVVPLRFGKGEGRRVIRELVIRCETLRCLDRR